MLAPAEHPLGMRRKPAQRRRWFLKDWRKFRELSQEALAERIGATQGLISQLENNRINYTRDQLEALGEALQCDPADLLTRNPLIEPEAPLAVWQALPAAERHTALEIMRLLKKTTGD